ncbi:hypothetical protein ABUK63_11810 [Lactococcus lactis]|uniref:hypothetical protein n=1 Tax=Lactococcus lactis TaxID=1358 RepID=UPI003D2C053B
MKKFSKKQIVTSSVILGVLVVGGVSAGVVTHNNNVQAQQVAKTKAHEAKVKADKKAKAEQLAKEKEAAQQKQVATLLATATKNPSDTSIKAVNDAIAKLTDQKEKTKDAEMVKGLNNRLALIKKAQAVVEDYQAHAMDANKQKAAQEAINKLKDKNDEDVKAELQKLFDESNNQAQAAAKASQATNQASSDSSSNSSANVNQAANQTQSNANASDSSQGGNYTYQAPANNSQQYVSGNTNSNNSGTASGYASSNTPSGNTNTGGSTSGGTAPSHTGGYGSIADLNQQEKEAGEASNNFPGGW